MEEPSFSLPDPKLQIRQNVEGDRNQAIGQVLGGMVVYSTVIYNNPAAAPDSATAQTKDLQIGTNPYQGLSAFQETDGDLFFGRDSQINELWEKFRGLQEQEFNTRLLTIYGPSGSGKSSLARAGLILRLASQPLPGYGRARVAVLKPSAHPLKSLETVLKRIAPYNSTFISEIDEQNWADLAVAKVDGLRCIADVLPEIEISPLIVLVDQLEEVFTLCENPKERDAFIDNLLCAAADRSKRVSVIVTLRSDFLGAVQKYPALDRLIQPQGFFVAAMTVDGLREAITKPAELRGYSLDSSTVNLLIEQTTGREGALPLLQFALKKIWDDLKDDQKEPAETLEKIGGVGGALAVEAQRIYQSLTSEEQEIARRVFLGLVHLGEGTKDTRRRTTLERIVSHRNSLEQVQKVINRFASFSTRLITLADNNGLKTVEVTHEALFDNWQQLKDWLNDGRNDLRFQRRLDEAVMVWLEHKKPEGSLWRSPDLDWLRKFHKRVGDDMNTQQLEFFKASINAEKHQRNILYGVGATFLLVILGSIVSISMQAQEANQQRRLADIERSALSARQQLSVSRNDALIFALESGQELEKLTIEAGSPKKYKTIHPVLMLQEILDKPKPKKDKTRPKKLEGHEGSVNSIRFSPDGEQLITASSDGTIRLWDARSAKNVKEFNHRSETGFETVRFTEKGDFILAGEGGIGLAASKIKIWHKNGAFVQEIDTKQNGIHSVNIYKNYVLTAGYDKTVKVYYFSSFEKENEYEHVATLPEDKDITTSRFSYDGRFIAIGGKEGLLSIWDIIEKKNIDNKKNRRECNYTKDASKSEEVKSLNFNRKGDRLASIGDINTIFLWSFPECNLINNKIKASGSLQSVNFSFDDEVVATTTEDGNAQFWTLDGLQLASFNIHLNKIRSATFSPDGLKFATASEDKTASVLIIRDLPELIKEGCEELSEHFKNHPSDKERLPICSSN